MVRANQLGERLGYRLVMAGRDLRSDEARLARLLGSGGFYIGQRGRCRTGFARAIRTFLQGFF